MRGARIYYPRVPRLMRDDHRRISSRCVRNRNSSCTTSLDHTRYKTLPARLARRPTRYKTLPASGLGRPTRYKTLPASPKTPISAHFSHAGRTLYRFRHQQPEQGELYPACGATSGTKLSQHARLGGPPGTKLSQQAARRPTRYKTLPASPKTPISAHFSHAGRTLYRFRHQHDKQGEKSHAPTPHRTHQRAPPQISHAIRLPELSITSRNVAIPTI